MQFNFISNPTFFGGVSAVWVGRYYQKILNSLDGAVKVRYTLFIEMAIQVSLVKEGAKLKDKSHLSGWGGRIGQLHICRGVIHPHPQGDYLLAVDSDL